VAHKKTDLPALCKRKKKKNEPSYFIGKGPQRIHHGIDNNLEQFPFSYPKEAKRERHKGETDLEPHHFTLYFDFNLLCQIALGYGLCDCRNPSDLGGQIERHLIHLRGCNREVAFLACAHKVKKKWSKQRTLSVSSFQVPLTF
jgi:hypothetical protein